MESKLRDALKRLWASGQPPLSPEGGARALDLEKHYGVQLPGDFAAYLREASPQEDWMDNRGIIWWRPECIKSVPDECGTPTPREQLNPEIESEAHQYLVFADYLCWCYAYAICCSDGPHRGKVALVGIQPDRFVASSFSTFLDLAAADSDRLHSPVGDHYRDLL